MQKLSKESANPKNKASLESITLDLSKSEELGFLIILIVIPKHLIKKNIFFLYLIFLNFYHFLFYILVLKLLLIEKT